MLGTLQTSAATCSSEVGERVCCSIPRQSGQISSPRPAAAPAGVPPLCEAAVAALLRTSSASMYTLTSRTPEKRSTQRWQTSLRSRVCATRELKSSVATAVRSDCCAISSGGTARADYPGRTGANTASHDTFTGRALEHVPRVRACACLPHAQLSMRSKLVVRWKCLPRRRQHRRAGERAGPRHGAHDAGRGTARPPRAPALLRPATACHVSACR